MAKDSLTPEMRKQLLGAYPELKTHSRTLPNKNFIRGLAEFLSLNPTSNVAQYNAQKQAAQQTRNQLQTHASNKQKLALEYHTLLNSLEAEGITSKKERDIAVLEGNKGLVKHFVDVMVSANTLRGDQSGQFSTLLGLQLDAQLDYKKKFDITRSSTETQTAYVNWQTALANREGPDGARLDQPGNQQSFMATTTEFLNAASARGDQFSAFGGVDDYLRENGYSGGVEQFMETFEGASDPDTGLSESPVVRQLQKALQAGRSGERASAAITAQRFQDLEKFSGKLEGLQGGFGPKALMGYVKKLNADQAQIYQDYKTKEAELEMNRPDTAGTQERLDKISEAVQERLPQNFARLSPHQQKLWIEAETYSEGAEILLSTEVYDNTTQAAFANIQQTEGFKDFASSRDYSNQDEATRDFIRLQQKHHKEISKDLGGEGGVRKEAKAIRGEAADPSYDPAPARVGALQKSLSQPSAGSQSVGGALLPTDEDAPAQLAELAKPGARTQFLLKQIGKPEPKPEEPGG